MINEFASLECIYLLWLATDGSVPLPLLLAPNFDSLFNLPKPGWSRVTLGNLLVKMRAARLIRFHLNVANCGKRYSNPVGVKRYDIRLPMPNRQMNVCFDSNRLT